MTVRRVVNFVSVPRLGTLVGRLSRGTYNSWSQRLTSAWLARDLFEDLPKSVHLEWHTLTMGKPWGKREKGAFGYYCGYRGTLDWDIKYNIISPCTCTLYWAYIIMARGERINTITAQISYFDCCITNTELPTFL